MDGVILCCWCGASLRVRDRMHVESDGTPHICGPHREPVHAMTMQDAEEAGSERSEAG